MDTPTSQTLDYTVKFQWDAGTSEYNTATTQDAVNDLICDTAAGDVPDDAGYTNTGTLTANSVVGVAFTGVIFLKAVSTDLVDPLFPAVYAGVTDTDSAMEHFDTCLAHPQNAGVYHYHAFAPCVVDAASYAATPLGCAQSDECTADVLAWGEAAFADYQTITPIGVAKDGRIIYGPYNDDGELVSSCDVDICNGATINGYYGYFATNFHPYVPACFGPGNYPTHSQECSTNARTCDANMFKVLSSAVLACFAVLMW